MDHALKRPVGVAELASALALEVVGNPIEITGVSALDSALPGALCYSKGLRSQGIRGVAIIVPRTATNASSMEGASLLSENPRLDFARALQWLDRVVGFVRDESPPRIDPSAVIGQYCTIGPGVSIGAHTRIANNVTIGANATIGAHCVIKSGAVIGEDGFGFERAGDGLPHRLLHLGSVVIGDHVEIGSLTTVCRGTLQSTIIDDHVKIDDHVHVAHNAVLRRGTMVTACAEISGGVEVGEFCWIGPNASVIQKVRIGSHSLVGIAANVLKDVPDRTVVVGNPAKTLDR